MWSLIGTLLNLILGWFGIGKGKSDAEIGLEKGEALGKAEQENADARQELQNIKKADDARRSVSDDPDSIVRDPDNQG